MESETMIKQSNDTKGEITDHEHTLLSDIPKSGGIEDMFPLKEEAQQSKIVLKFVVLQI